MPELPENIIFPMPKTQKETDLYNSLNAYVLKVSQEVNALTGFTGSYLNGDGDTVTVVDGRITTVA